MLQGGEAACRDDTDHELDFRQESYFHYLFGVREPEWWGAINLATGASTLFMPRLPATYAIWQGRIATPDEMRARYAPEAVRYVDELADYLAEHLAIESPKPSAAAARLRLHVLAGPNTVGRAAAARRARRARGPPRPSGSPRRARPRRSRPSTRSRRRRAAAAAGQGGGAAGGGRGARAARPRRAYSPSSPSAA